MKSERLSALNVLLQGLEAGDDVRDHIHALFSESGGPVEKMVDTFRDASNGNLNAAEILHDTLLPEWAWEISINSKEEKPGAYAHVASSERGAMAWNGKPARAWLKAVLKALIAEIESNHHAAQRQWQN